MNDIEALSVIDALFIALSGLTVVFLMLGSLAILISIISKVVQKLEANTKDVATATPEPTLAPAVVSDAENSTASINHEYQGTIKLIDVDERTAVCIMAIISDETGIPLSELIFKQIRAL